MLETCIQMVSIHKGKKKGSDTRLKLGSGGWAWGSNTVSCIAVAWGGAALDQYTGQWCDGGRTGKGICIYADGRRYEGQWKNDAQALTEGEENTKEILPSEIGEEPALLRSIPPPLSTDRLVHRPLGGRTVTFGTIKIFAEGEIFEKLPLNIHENGLEMCKFSFFQSQWDLW